MDCAKNYSLYKEFMKVGSYDLAVEPYWELLNECPRFHKKMYEDGVRIYARLRSNIVQEPERLSGITDTMMMLFDRHIKNFGDTAKMLAGKAMLAVDFSNNDDDYLKAYSMMKQAVAAFNNNPEPDFLYNYLKLAVHLYDHGKLLSDDLYRDLVPSCVALFGRQDDGNESTKKYIRNCLSFFVKHSNDFRFNELFDAEQHLPGTVPEFVRLSLFMSASDNVDNSLLSRASDAIFARYPVADTAVAVAAAALGCKRYDIAVMYSDKALSITEGGDARYKAMYVLSNAYLFQSKLDKAYRIAKMAIAEYPDSCASMYLVLAKIYSEYNSMVGAIFKLSDFEKKELFWIADDYARRCIDMGGESSDAARKLQADFIKAYCPKKDDAFMNSVMPGDKVVLKLFDTESTTARF